MNTSRTLPFADRLRKKIYAFGGSIWKEKWTEGIEKKWLDNFQDPDNDLQEKERINMLYLLSKFMFFGSNEVRQLLMSIFRDLYKYPIVEKIRLLNSDTVDTVFISQKFDEELAATRFLGVGNPSESGVHLLYYFRQECGLSKEQFVNTSEVFSPKTIPSKISFLRPIMEAIGISNWPRSRTYFRIANRQIKRYIFIDDFCGSGSQATNYLRSLVETLKSENPDLIVCYFMLFATEVGIQNVKKLALFDSVDAVFTIDKSFKAFSDVSRYFKVIPDSQIEKSFSKGTAEKYGNKLFSPALGYEDGQLLLGLFHNTPDNTLPVFWSQEDGWLPVFKRYHKIY